MGWAAHRIEEYRHGAPATWLERRMLEHANPLHFALALIATVGFLYGLWFHEWIWIVGAAILALAGHAYCWFWKPRLPKDSGTAVPAAGAR